MLGVTLLGIYLWGRKREISNIPVLMEFMYS